MARRRFAEVLAFALVIGAPGLCLAQFGGPGAPDGPLGPPGGQPGSPPGMPGAPPSAGGPPTPEMAKRLDSIRVLREIVRMRLGKADIAAALPALRALLQADKAAQAQAVEALEQEKRALLSARSPADMPPPPSDRLRQQARKLRAEQDKRWGELAKVLGSARAAELKRLLNPMRQGPDWPGMGAPGGFGGPGGPAMQPGAPRQPGPRPGGAGPPGMPGMAAAAAMDAPYVSLADLISLLEQRLAALK